MQPSSLKRNLGYSVIELLFALMAVLILCALASGSVSAAINAARTSNAAASLYSSLLRARSAAVSSGNDIALCPSSDAVTCSAGDHWENGWIGFVAVHGTNARQNGDTIILTQPALPKNVHLVTSSGRTHLRFQALGSGNAGSNATFTFCDRRGAAKASAYALGNGGGLHPTVPTPTNVAEAFAGV